MYYRSIIKLQNITLKLIMKNNTNRNMLIWDGRVAEKRSLVGYAV